MIVDLEEIKNVMKVDNNDDDKTIETLLNANISLVKSIFPRINSPGSHWKDVNACHDYIKKILLFRYSFC